MNIYLYLFLTFLKIGAVSFGGGYGMIALIKEECLSNNWLTEGQLLDFVAIAESTPGPIAVNIATFVGSSQAGILGSLCATFGVVLPSFVIILIIVSLIGQLLKYKGVKAFLNGIKPAIVGLIIGTALTLMLSMFLGLSTINNSIIIDYKNIIVFASLFVFSFLFKLIFKKKVSTVIMIIFSGVMGIILFM